MSEITTKLEVALAATAKHAAINNQLEFANKILRLVQELIAAEKYAEAKGAIQALELLASA